MLTESSARCFVESLAVFYRTSYTAPNAKHEPHFFQIPLDDEMHGSPLAYGDGQEKSIISDVWQTKLADAFVREQSAHESQQVANKRGGMDE